MSDGLVNLRNCLKSAYAFCQHLPPEEREFLKTLYVQIDVALGDR
jgi:hypothetical protein